MRMVLQLRKELGTSQGTVKRAADQLGCGVESLRMGVKQDEIDRGQAAGTTSEDAARVKALEREVKALRRANEISKKASVISRWSSTAHRDDCVR